MNHWVDLRSGERQMPSRTQEKCTTAQMFTKLSIPVLLQSQDLQVTMQGTQRHKAHAWHGSESLLREYALDLTRDISNKPHFAGDSGINLYQSLSIAIKAPHDAAFKSQKKPQCWLLTLPHFIVFVSTLKLQFKTCKIMHFTVNRAV